MNVEHLQMIQNIINRMSQVSFILKGWSVTIIVAMFGVAANSSISWLALLALIPSILFGGLDAYYLRQERLFRCLYQKISLDSDGQVIPPYSMNTNICESNVDSWWKTLYSPTIGWFYSITIILSAIITILLYISTSDV